MVYGLLFAFACGVSGLFLLLITTISMYENEKKKRQELLEEYHKARIELFNEKLKNLTHTINNN